MALNITSVPRVFLIDGKRKSDPDPNLSPEDVKKYLSRESPSLINSKIKGPTIKYDNETKEPKEAVYELIAQSGNLG